MNDHSTCIRPAGLVPVGTLAAAWVVLGMSAPALAQSTTTFSVSGPATTGEPGMWGDAMLDSVEFPTGEIFTDFITAKAITFFECASSSNWLGWSVSTGTECTTGETGWFKVESEDGDSSTITDADRESFSQRILDTLNDRNLNSLVHLKDSHASFVMEFNELIRDNDPEADDFGEILYFERGAGAGNSACYIQAVDAAGEPLGPQILISGDDTGPTTPLATIGTPWAPSLTNQTIGCTAIDLTRLGVTELRYLKVSNASHDPDLKIFAVWTQARIPDPLRVYD